MSLHKAQFCAKHQNKHYDITPEEKEEMLNAYVFGDAQIVTTAGLMDRCILDLIGYRNVLNERSSNRAAKYPADLLSDMSSVDVSFS